MSAAPRSRTGRGLGCEEGRTGKVGSVSCARIGEEAAERPTSPAKMLLLNFRDMSILGLQCLVPGLLQLTVIRWSTTGLMKACGVMQGQEGTGPTISIPVAQRWEPRRVPFPPGSPWRSRESYRRRWSRRQRRTSARSAAICPRR